MQTQGSSRFLFSFPFWFGLGTVGLYGLLIAWRVDPRLLFYQQEPVLLTGRDFLTRFAYLGGPVDFLSVCLTFLCAWRWVGAALLAALAGGIAFFVGRIGKVGVLSFPLTLSLLTLLLVRYTIPLTVMLGIFFTLLLTWVYQRFDRFPLGVRLGGFAVLYAGLYAWAGGMAFFFGLLGLLVEALSSRSGRWWFFVIAALAWMVLLTILVDPIVWILPPRQTILGGLVSGQRVPLRWEVLVALAGLTLEIILLKRLRGVLDFPFKNPHPIWMTGALLFWALLPLLVMGLTLEGKAKARLTIRMAAAEGRWEAVLAEVRRHPEVDRLSAFHMHRALFHLGSLGDLMFRYPQVWGVEGLIPLKEAALRVAMDYSDFWMELGHYNAAEHWAYEALTQKGETPRVLRRLVEVHLIEGNKPMVSTVRRLLQRVPFSDRWARAFPGMKDAPDSTLRWVETMRKRGIDSDFLVHLNLPEMDLVSLLKRNPTNRMAYEYLMAYSLLSGRLDGFVRELGRVSSFGFNRLPLHWEEALVLLWRHAGKNEPVFAGFRLGEETLGRYRAFEAVLARYGGNPELAHEELRDRFGGTYWYYALYGDPGRKEGGRRIDGRTGATP